MIITRAPVRIGIGGGGSDLPAYYRQYGGRVVNATVNRYVYVVLSSNRRGSVQLTSSDFSAFLNFEAGADLANSDDALALVRAALADFGLSGGIDVFTASETPPGTGLGSSSATAVALVAARAGDPGGALAAGGAAATRAAPALGCVPVAVVDPGTAATRAVGRYGIVARLPEALGPEALAADVAALVSGRSEPAKADAIETEIRDMLKADRGGIRVHLDLTAERL